MVEIVDAERAVAIEDLVRHRRFRRHRHLARRVDEIEFEFGRHDRRQAEHPEPFADGGQCAARVAKEGLARLVHQPERHQRGRRAEPVHRQEAPARRRAAPVDVAEFVDQRIAREILAPDVETGDGIGHAHMAFEHFARLGHGDALAAQDAIEVAHGGAQAGDFGAAFQPLQGFGGFQLGLQYKVQGLARRRRARQEAPVVAARALV